MLKSLQWLGISVLVVILDQLTKWYAVQHLAYDAPYRVFSFFNFTLAYNTGIAFSWFSRLGVWHSALLFFIMLVIVIGLLIWMLRTPAHDVFQYVVLALIIGGAVGNMIDRVRLGYVIDFMDFHINTWHFATFNVADMAVSIGAALWVLKAVIKPQP